MHSEYMFPSCSTQKSISKIFARLIYMETNNKLKQLKLFFIFIIFLTVTSCSSLSPYKVPILQGNLFEEEDIEKLSEGLSKEQVQFIFGTALLKDPFHSNRWDYYYSIKVGTDILTESKLSILFDEDGLVDSWTIEKMEESN